MEAIRGRRVIGRCGLILMLAALGQGCAASTEADGDVADLRGTWTYEGTQSAPTLSLEGSLVVSSQNGDVVQGQLSWEEMDPIGGSRLDGGAVTGRVIGHSDVDFDVLMPAGERRHVARLVADTMRGAWIQLSTGTSGEFTAVRATP